MLVFDPNDAGTPKWRTFEPEVEILIAPVNRQVRRDLRKQAQDSGPQIDERALDAALRRHMVRDWRGICDAAGNPLACTPANVDAVLSHFGVLEDWISGHAATMAEAEAREKARLLKNSKDLPDGPQPDPQA